MPYATTADLPPAVRRHLSEHAREIYRSAINHTWESYRDEGERREQIAQRVAWAAVKRRYRKAGADWTPADGHA
jgi:cation transport regulator